ncbi:MAG TPA: family 78 glycoside hydrolase catalytic domain, partial [Tepidisphaeraceae bacterium]|nr:family 78 glycoside hydrolase catalytic domain [Tepidisphaeraceae bacterium]
MRCESRDVPMGIDTTHPRLSWTLASDERGQRQSAYQIQVTSSAGRFDTPDLWDSGKVSSDESASIAYAGKPLNSLATCAWRVRVWDVNDHPSSWTDGPAWTMGLLAPSDWQAKWIDRGNGPAATQPTTPMPRFSKTFRAAQPVKRALIAICGLGQFDLRINGKPARDDFLQPGWTDYRKTCLYVLYDVTPLLQRDQNVVSVTLGNGMYNCVGGRYTKFKASFGPPKLIAQLRLDYADGTSQTIGTDSSWKTGDSSTTFSSIYGGEDVDARISSDESASSSAHETDGPGGTLACASKSALPIQIDHVLTPVKITEPRPGVFVYDMGQNCAQVPQLRVSGPAGTKVVLEPSELLHPDGMIAPQSTGAKLGGVHSTYTLRGGGGVETFEPRFYYAGCRYWQVTGAIPKDSAGADDPTKAVVQELRGQFVTSTSPIAGEFECSSEMFNRTRTLIRWAMRSNMMSVLTDCPHRERLGWLEQDHLVGPSITYNFDVQALLGKICNDMAEAQHDDGLMPDIAPEYVKFKGGFLDSPEWGSACVLVPWQAYQSYGDEQVLRDHLDTMTRYVEYLNRQSKEHILDFGLGDWYDLGPKPPGIAQLTPKALTATAFFYRDASLVAQIAKLLGRAEDATKYASLAGEICEAFNRAFYDAAHHRYATGSQTGDALPLVFGMVPETDRAAVLDDLV